MAVHKLILDDDFDDAAYVLIAIHCRLEDYRLAYLLNKTLGINLARKALDIDVKNGRESYSIFEWKDEEQLTIWNLVSNICKGEETFQTSQGSLFENGEKITKIYHLLPEHKKVNYFLKIEGNQDPSIAQQVLGVILSLPQIATAYNIDTNQLKSKNNLIFN